MRALQPFETRHPDKGAAARYEALVGIDAHKQVLLDELLLYFDPGRTRKWLKRHHPKDLPALDALAHVSPLLILSGEVGCGKSALATSVGTPLAKELDGHVLVMETPSDLRGGGHVGELSSRITAMFEHARARATQQGPSLLLLDEADDVATAREQAHAHHEDRAGVNVLIKEVDHIVREKVPLAVLLITNRASALDPAVLRRAALQLDFARPNNEQRKAVFEHLLRGVDTTKRELEALVAASRPRKGVLFSFSDITVRLARAALRKALGEDRPFGASVLQDALSAMEPSPLVCATPEEQEI